MITRRWRYYSIRGLHLRRDARRSILRFGVFRLRTVHLMKRDTRLSHWRDRDST